MNNKIIYNIISIVCLLIIMGCDKENDYEIYQQEPLSSDIVLVYPTFDTYPILDVLSSEPPTTGFTGTLRYFLGNIKASNGGTFQENKFSIEEQTGVISYDNTGGTLTEGAYSLGVKVGNTYGFLVYEDVLKINISAIPLGASIDQAEVDAGIFEEGVLATVSYVDSSPDQVLTDISYALAANAPVGFSIDSESGAISKTAAAQSGANQISVVISSNLGSKQFDNILTVNVGAAPTLEIYQQDDLTLLTKVLMSPLSSYTSSVPQIEGMDVSGGFELVLPEALIGFESSFDIGENGQVSIDPQSSLPEGLHSIGIKATNASGLSFTFNEVLQLEIISRWEETPVFSEDFSDAGSASTSLLAYNAAMESYRLNGSIATYFVQHTNSAKNNVRSMKVVQQGNQTTSTIDGMAVLTLPVDSSWIQIRVSFTEAFGYGPNRLGWYERWLYAGYDNSDVTASSPTFNANQWDVVMAPTDEGWSTSSLWNNLPSDAAMHQVPAQVYEIDSTQSNLYLGWRLLKTGTASGGAQFHIDSIVVEVMKAFDAEEQ